MSCCREMVAGGLWPIGRRSWWWLTRGVGGRLSAGGSGTTLLRQP
jgi:hypothetical protein